MQLEFCEDEESVLVLDVVCGFDIADAKNILRDRPYDRCTFSVAVVSVVREALPYYLLSSGEIEVQKE